MAQEIPPEIWQKRMTAGEAANLVTSSPVVVSGAMRTLEDWMRLGYITVDYAGVLHWAVDVNGKLLTVEASAANIYGYTQNVSGWTEIGAGPKITGFTSTVQTPYARRIGRAYITCSAGGDAVFTDLVPALAGYYGVLRIKGVKTSIASAAGTCAMTFQSPAATAALPNIELMPVPLAANTRYTNIGPFTVTHSALTDAQAIGVVLTDWGAPSAAVVEIEFEYWYET